ncbi:aspartate/glutamate racemase family protein [Fulvimarina sp. 2208YS6-2-32]|uniref:Aspartate/glutamate racemase family protein n=1 Tax=Fulvimarina uroteuthidis TaxID=3098149 RepID=A0ABU5HYX2_9HYPH|nr:aspartate/glutamate racemase family protein [Fulvimarina sp. 2208YS6-2-32]MDY8108319.1 aspartate/glutamate racemase family protein [Fulvimarina sp. 2208YS6-2-32]
MRISIVNPNSTRSMTDTVAKAARQAAARGTEILAYQNDAGPLSIEGYVDGAHAVPGLLHALAVAESDGAEAHIIACFDDTGLDAARSMLTGPVIGIGEAGARMASLVARRFSVVTTLSVSVPILEDNLARAGLAGNCASVRASEIPVLALDTDPEAADAKIGAEIERAITQDRAEAIVLGCAGMADMAADLSARFGVPVIDGVASAVKLMEGALTMGLKTSKRGGYAAPRVKQDARLAVPA